MIKKKDPYIALLDFYYEKFPEPITLKETYEFFHDEGYLSSEELEVIKAFGKTRQKKEFKEAEVEISAERKRQLYEMLFLRAGHTTYRQAGRNAPYILNSEHYFHRLEYIELQEARKSSRTAFIISMIAIFISFASLCLTWGSLNKPISISQGQVNQIVKAIQENE